MAFRLIGVRHGEVHNPGHVIYSSLPDFRLSERGRAEAAEVASALRELDVAAIYSSPLDRAVETATAIADAAGVAFTTDERLVEWRYWEGWAGQTWEAFEQTGDPWDTFMTDPGALEDRESLAELADRISGALDDIQAWHQDGLVVVVSHLEPLRAYLLQALGRPASDVHRLLIGHCGVVALRPQALADPLQLADLAAHIGS